MSFEPPKTDRPNQIPGYIVVLAAFSVLTLLFSIGIGLVAFGVVDTPWSNNDEPIPTVGVEGQALQASGFTVLDQSEVDGRPTFAVNVSVTNTGDESLENVMMLVQCLDGGNVSNSQLILSIDPTETRTFELELYGTGEPACSDPTISFDEDEARQLDPLAG